MSRAPFSRALVAALTLFTSPALAGMNGSKPLASATASVLALGQTSTPASTQTQQAATQAPPAPAQAQTSGIAPAAQSETAAQPPAPGIAPTAQTQAAAQTPAPGIAPTAQTQTAAQPPATTQELAPQPTTSETAPASAQTQDAVQQPADAQAQDTGVAQPSEAAASADDEAMLAESSAPPPGFTGVFGKVSDEANGEGLIEATVKVVTGAQKQVLTDLDGNYRLALPPGKYDLRVFYDVYQGRRITGVVVTQGKATKLDVALGADVGAVQEVVVEARSDRRAEGALLQERKKAAAVSDAISAQEISRTPDSSASDAVKRVVSATIVDGRYVLLRGLGGRYSTTLLNGALLPSPEPDEPSVPLDLFPTSLLANLNVVKSYTADLPGSFGGGTLLIETNTYPSQFEFKPRITFGGDSETTGKTRNTQPGSAMEFLGFPGSQRRLPDAIPTNHALGDGNESLAERERQWESFPNIWQARSKTALPNMGLSASLGDTLRFDNQRLGYLASFNYGHKESIQLTQNQEARFDDDGSYTSYDDARAKLGMETATLSGLASIGYQLDRDNELTVFSLYTRGTETRTTTNAGSDTLRADRFEGGRLQFIVRQLSFNQLRGFHRVGFLGDAEIDWQANLSRVDRDEPDTRDTYYSVPLSNPSGAVSFPDQPNSGERFFATLGETSGGGSVNLTVPFTDVRLKVGGLAQFSGRDFRARRFRYKVDNNSEVVVDRFLPPEQLFGPEHVGNGILMTESTRSDSDAYDASLGVFAGYVTADATPTEQLRLVGGVRLEASQQKLTALNQFTGVEQSNNQVSYLDWLPSFNAIYALTPTVNVRAGYSYTLARPSFRELAPFSFFDFVRRRNVSGNPELKETRIHNIDTRIEWFVGDNEVLAASAFYKRFQDPIERVINSVGGDMNFENTAGADTYGLEMEARTSLGRLTPALQPVRVGANLTLIQSKIDLGNVRGIQTSAERPLQGQSPYVINVNAGYEHAPSGTEVALLYNVYGRRITEVGTDNLPDVYEQPFHRVDLAVTQKLTQATQLKLTASNLLNSKVTLKQGDVTILQYRPGIAFSASLGLSL